MQGERHILGDADTDDECVSPDTIPMDDLVCCVPFQSAPESAAANANAISNIICAAADDDANSVMTAATLNATTTAAENLGFDHPDVVEQLMKFDFDFSDSRSQSICLAHH